MRTRTTARVILAAAVRIAIAIATLAAAPRPTLANTDMAKRTGQPCAKCHTAAPALSGYGKKYKDSLKK